LIFLPLPGVVNVDTRTDSVGFLIGPLKQTTPERDGRAGKDIASYFRILEKSLSIKDPLFLSDTLDTKCGNNS
jgi:hypothetical protein